MDQHCEGTDRRSDQHIDPTSLPSDRAERGGTEAPWREILARALEEGGRGAASGVRDEETPWRFEQAAAILCQVSHHVLALGAEAGEMLARIGQDVPQDAAATARPGDELDRLRAALEEAGVEVAAHDPVAPGASLPFAPERFDLVLCSHGAFDPQEVRRVLAPGGILLIQQRAEGDLAELRGDDQDPSAATETLQSQAHRLTQSGFAIERSEVFHGRTEFASALALAGSVGRAPWAADADAAALEEAIASLEPRFAQGPVALSTSSFLIQARMPAAPEPGRVDFSQLLDEQPEVPKV